MNMRELLILGLLALLCSLFLGYLTPLGIMFVIFEGFLPKINIVDDLTPYALAIFFVIGPSVAGVIASFMSYLRVRPLVDANVLSKAFLVTIKISVGVATLLFSVCWTLLVTFWSKFI